MDTGICIEDVVQSLIDLRLAYTGKPTNEINPKQPEARNRRRHNIQYDDINNNLDPSSVLIIDTDKLSTVLNHLSTGNLSSKHSQNTFDPACLRLMNRR